MSVVKYAWVVTVVSLASIASGVVAQQQRGVSLVDKVRGANDRFKDMAVAVAEGYAPIPCASGVDGGAMGVHYASEKLLKADTADIAYPQAVMYEQNPRGAFADMHPNVTCEHAH